MRVSGRSEMEQSVGMSGIEVGAGGILAAVMRWIEAERPETRCGAK